VTAKFEDHAKQQGCHSVNCIFNRLIQHIDLKGWDCEALGGLHVDRFASKCSASTAIFSWYKTRVNLPLKFPPFVPLASILSYGQIKQ
jgi:hypothetical protein